MGKWPLFGVMMAIFVAVGAPVMAASTFADPAFQSIWATTEAKTANFWGPLATARDGQREAYRDSPGGQRLVQYFDKARMELNQPGGPVTTGLLTVELKTGQMQSGDTIFTSRGAARINVAGDPGSDGVTYADLARLPERSPQVANAETMPPLGLVGQTGQFAPVQNLPVANLPSGGIYGPYLQDPAGRYGQYVFRPFYDFINALPTPFFQTTGYPITPLLIGEVRVAGVSTFVLMQAFERRVLTFNGNNPPAFRVEFGNIGQHYYAWRYAGTPSVVPGRIIVGFRPGLTTAERADVHQGARARGALPGTVIGPVGPDADLVDVSAAPSLDAAAKAYTADPRVRYAEPDAIATTTGR